MKVSRPARNWAAYDQHLVRRGGVFTFVVDQASVAASWRVHTGRRGRPAYSRDAINACWQVKALLGRSLRYTEGFLREVFTLSGLDANLVPDHTTLSRHRGDVDLWVPDLPAGGVILIDGTGITTRTPGDYRRDKYKDTTKRPFVRVTLTTDAATGTITAASVTADHGAGTGETSQVPALLAGQTHGPTVLVGDGAYDTHDVYARATARGMRVVVPPHVTATYGLHPARDITITQVKRHGMDGWKTKSGYHVRSLVEATNSAVKTTTGSSTAAHTHTGATADVLARLSVYNRMLNLAL